MTAADGADARWLHLEQRRVKKQFVGIILVGEGHARVYYQALRRFYGPINMSRPCVKCKHSETRRTDGAALDAGEDRDE